MLHIGIAACSAEGASLCYRTICTEAARVTANFTHPEITMHTPSLAEYVERLERDDWDGVAELMLASAHKLATAGADFLICPDNTIHQALPTVAKRSPKPWLHIAEVVAASAAARGFARVGVLGTRWLVASDVYPGALAARGIEAVRPPAHDAELVSGIIMDELVAGIARPDSIRQLQTMIDRLRETGCDAVVLGCTELPIVLDDSNSSLPTLDSTRLLASAALHRALAG
ncbi:MAG TPA: amino acid racemase [Kofleriaceae bacterium]|nr:amino acid racemase [Kofleriaceae bacterium]